MAPKRASKSGKKNPSAPKSKSDKGKSKGKGVPASTDPEQEEGPKDASRGFSSSGGLRAADSFVGVGQKDSVPLLIVQLDDFESWLGSAPVSVAAWLKGVSFRPSAGKSILLPGDEGPLGALVVVGDAACPWDYADLPRDLPPLVYDAEPDLEAHVAFALCLGWALGGYRFQRYKEKKIRCGQLVWPKRAPRNRVLAVAEGMFLARDLITTPASDMGPEQLADEAQRVAKVHGAKFGVTTGEDLLAKNFPMVHAVGRASIREPRLIDLRWGKGKAPLVTLVGKGVCFDSGGLDLKPSQYMLLMKKDMGGAALVLGLAHAIMSLDLPIRVRVLIPAVENSVSGNAMRPLDVLKSRQGITVEIGDTDAEGRLVLADALAEAVNARPDLIIDAATLTGAARVALGTGMPAVFANSTETWHLIETAAAQTYDPLWRLPLHEPYRKKLDSRVADISSTGDAYAGAITAALFLREFVGKDSDWVHIDTMGYNNETLPGRPKGGEAMGLRALLAMLEQRYA